MSLDRLVNRLSKRETLQGMLARLHEKKAVPKQASKKPKEIPVNHTANDLHKAIKLATELNKLVSKDSFKQIKDGEDYNIFVSLTGATTEVLTLLKSADL